jgi:hypothetical protein
MEVASEITSREFAGDFDTRSTGLASIISRKRTVVLLCIVALGVGLRLYGISSYSLVVDEYGSIVEGQRLGLNWNSIIYSTVMHFWLPFGQSEFWLRLPAAIFGMATVPILFKVGEQFGGWRTGAVAALLAGTSPFNIYHSQEVRFYSLFMLAAAAFLLATAHYVQSERTTRSRIWMTAAAGFLLMAHFLGFIALYAQGAAAFLATKRRSLITVLAITIGIPLILFGLPLLPPVRSGMVYLYQVFGNAAVQNTAITPVSFISVVKIVFAAFTFVFGYHVYPLRLLLVITGAALTTFLIVCGIVRLIREGKWAALVLTNCIAVIGIYVVLDAVGGRLATGVSPRHIAFAWPPLIIVLALGLTRFHKTAFKLLLFAVVGVNAASLASAWTKDWTYGVATDYRAAAEYAGHWTKPNTLLVYGPNAVQPIYYYFPNNAPRVDWYSFLQNRDGSMSQYDRIIVVSDDWRPNYRFSVNQLLQRLNENYSCTDGRAEYPLFEYVFDRRATPAVSPAQSGRQLALRPTAYGLEFQDLRLPIDVDVRGTHLHVIGASQLPDFDGQKTITILNRTGNARRLILLTNAILDQEFPERTVIAEAVLEFEGGAVDAIPLRLGSETNAWNRNCTPNAACETALRWHKRMAIVGQNTYSGAWRDFEGGIHAVALDLPAAGNLQRISLRYIAPSGHLYVWAVALV